MLASKKGLQVRREPSPRCLKCLIKFLRDRHPLAPPSTSRQSLHRDLAWGLLVLHARFANSMSRTVTGQGCVAGGVVGCGGVCGGVCLGVSSGCGARYHTRSLPSAPALAVCAALARPPRLQIVGTTPLMINMVNTTTHNCYTPLPHTPNNHTIHTLYSRPLTHHYTPLQLRPE